MIEIGGIKFCTSDDPVFFLPAWAPVSPQVVRLSAPVNLGFGDPADDRPTYPIELRD